jgi:NO-binding membrane sensor protein with MHYT domain
MPSMVRMSPPFACTVNTVQDFTDLAAYVGLSLAVQIADAAGLRRRLLLAGATASFAVAIWTMHFVGMLAVRLPFQVDYLVFPTLLSFLVCTIVVGAAVYRFDELAVDLHGDLGFGHVFAPSVSRGRAIWRVRARA